jgi:hypothetical protein
MREQRFILINVVIPAQAGISATLNAVQASALHHDKIPACAGMTKWLAETK